MSTTKFQGLALLASSLIFLNACSAKVDCDEEPDHEDCQEENTISRPAYPILEEYDGLSQFYIHEFELADKNFRAEMINYGLAQNTDPSNSEIEDDPTLNLIPIESDIWEEIYIDWGTNDSPFATESSLYLKNKPYRLLIEGELKNSVDNSKNQPTFTAAKKNINELQQAVSFTWDFGDTEIENVLDLNARMNVANSSIKNYETHPDTTGTLYEVGILPYATQWADNTKFSEDAIIYGGTRSVTEDVLIIESLLSGNSFSLPEANFDSGFESINAVIAQWPSDNNAAVHLNIKFSVAYLEHFDVKVQFNINNQTAQIFTTNNANVSICHPGDDDAKLCDRFEVPYIEHPDENYIEIDLSLLSHNRLQSLNLPGYFNLIIAGPFDETNNYFYGKHYIQTNSDNRIKLAPQFWLNPIAAKDVRNQFQLWRQEAFDDL
ncbi:MAG: hypothetical protein HRU20_19150 [Pseudomonadales bacterium]|nr:hypothetical protein [Pseudomonadales bacterium]